MTAPRPNVLFILSDQHNAKDATSFQSELHYGNAVNADGKVHPDRVRDVGQGNYV